ncbi:relaxase/mobilization nuclease domain-containing protein [Hyphococcus sp.]|uniref:relaxase/mobilization nuclease domain-containing protein n=1 Tax=Hyphococcus sp. TaxID=2038636 RepID=UPI0035C6B755
MILVGNQRGGAKNLANHLLSQDNEHVEVHEIRGFASDDLHGAFHEAYAMSKGTRCKQFLFSLSLNPPAQERVKTPIFEEAISKVETKLGLENQPRAIVFHEKEGRRHAHVVWSRINAEEMKAVQLSYSHRKLQEVSREIYLEHGWKLPKGIADHSKSDPRNFTLDEWQQAKRQGQDPRAIKTALQDAWAISDNKAAFENALKERGFILARGDRRGFVVLDQGGNIHALGKKTVGATAKDVRNRLGDPKELMSLEDARVEHSRMMQETLSRLDRDLEAQKEKQLERYEKQKADLIARQQEERQKLFEAIEARQQEETKARQEKFRSGIGGFWDKLRGEHKRIQSQNEKEAYESLMRDRQQKDQLIFQQLEQRRALDAMRRREEERFEAQHRDLEADRKTYAEPDLNPDKTDQNRQEVINARKTQEEERQRMPERQLDR